MTSRVDSGMAPPSASGMRQADIIAAARRVAVMGARRGTSTLHWIREHQSGGSVQLRFVETADDSRPWVFDGVNVAASLHLQVDVLEAGPCALSGGANSANALPALDSVTDPNGDFGEMAIDGAVALRIRIMVDHDDQTTQAAIVPRDGYPAVCRRQHVRSGAPFDVEATMATE